MIHIFLTIPSSHTIIHWMEWLTQAAKLERYTKFYQADFFTITFDMTPSLS